MYQRVVFGEVKHQNLLSLKDLEKREIAILIPIFIFILWIGIYPGTFLKLSEKSTNNVIQQVLVNPNTDVKVAKQ
jgi:NADH-quinone oxidoreductase subunit M